MENKETKKLKARNKLLISLIITLILFVMALGYYKFFIKENKKTNNIKDTKTEENNIVKEEEKVEDTNRSLTREEIAKVIYKFPYENLLVMKDKNVSNLTDKEKFMIGLYGLSLGDFKKIEIKELCTPEYMNNEKYTKVYNSKDKDLNSNQLILYSMCIGKKDGLTDDKLLNINSKMWNQMVGNMTDEDLYFSININKLYSIVKARTGLDLFYSKTITDYVYLDPVLDLHFKSDMLREQYNRMSWLYIKDLDKLYFRPLAQDIYDLQHSIIESGKKENDNYIITIYSGYFNWKFEDVGAKYYLTKAYKGKDMIGDAISTSITDKAKSDLVYKSKELLNKYNITFKKVGDNYQFVSIDYIE